MIETNNADQKKFSIIFYGTPDIARDILSFILKDSRFEVKLVITQPDTIAGRGKKLQAPQVKELALENHLPVIQPINIKKNKSILVDVNKYGPFDIAIVVAYGQIIPESLLNIPKAGSLNIHVSLLPRWRGAAPIQHAILAGDPETGVCLMKMDAGLDTGPVFVNSRFEITQDDNAESVFTKSIESACMLLQQNLIPIIKGEIEPEPQSEIGITYASKIEASDLLIDWNKPATEIHNRIRAFAPKPGALTFLSGKRLKIYATSIFPATSKDFQPGKIQIFDQNTLLIDCLDGCLKIEELQLEGKNKMFVADFLRGQKHLPEFLG